MYGDQFGEFVFGYWGLKGYNSRSNGSVKKWPKLMMTLHYLEF